MFAESYYTKHLSKKVTFEIGKQTKKKKPQLYIFIRNALPWLWRYGLVSLHPNHYCEQKMAMM